MQVHEWAAHIFTYPPRSCLLHFPQTSFRGHSSKLKSSRVPRGLQRSIQPSMGPAAPGACVPAWLPPPVRLCLSPYFLPWLTQCTHRWDLRGQGCVCPIGQCPWVPILAQPLSTNLLNKHMDHPLSFGEHLRWDRHLQDPDTGSFCPQEFPASFPPGQLLTSGSLG